jgi:hypothetical protein
MTFGILKKFKKIQKLTNFKKSFNIYKPCNPSLHTFNLVQMHAIEWAPYTTGVFLLWTNQGRVERIQSVWISELK